MIHLCRVVSNEVISLTVIVSVLVSIVKDAITATIEIS